MHTRSQKVAAGAGFECSTIRLGDKGLFYLSRTICRLFSKIHTHTLQAGLKERESKAVYFLAFLSFCSGFRQCAHANVITPVDTRWVKSRGNVRNCDHCPCDDSICAPRCVIYCCFSTLVVPAGKTRPCQFALISGNCSRGKSCSSSLVFWCRQFWS